MSAPVPDACLGVWKRTLLRTPESEDTTSAVFWLQTPHWHGDIRIPASRPPCAGRHGLDECSPGELAGLARQQGFAGITTVEGDICRWQRRVDFQPPGRFDDVGRIEFATQDRMLEYGVQQDYFEIWERLPGSTGDVVVAVEPDAAIGTTTRPSGILLATGAWFIRVRPRAAVLPPADALLALATDDAWLRDALDFEISLGTRGPDRWRITHSTLPWLEGTALTNLP
jgi:hypothetical protein